MDSRKSFKDLLVGLIFIALGLAFGYAASTYDIGTPLRMGPGYFPLILAGLLILLGAITFIGSFQKEHEEMGPIPWRAIVLLTSALLIFGFSVRGLGLVPALALVVFLSAFASRRTGLLTAVLLTIGLVTFCVLVFIEALGLPLRLFGPWLNF